MSAREVIADQLIVWGHEDGKSMAVSLLRTLTASGYLILEPDDAKLVKTALEHASFALDGVVALDDEDEGKDGGSDTCQHAKRTVDRALKVMTGEKQ